MRRGKSGVRVLEEEEDGPIGVIMSRDKEERKRRKKERRKNDARGREMRRQRGREAE